MNAVYKKMIAVINTIIASSFYRNPYQTNIKKQFARDVLRTACGPSWA